MRLAEELFAPKLLLFNLFMVYIGMLFAPSFSLRVVALITIAFVSARSAGVIMNRYVGREGDLRNYKKTRSMLSLRIPKRTLLSMFVVFSAIFLASAYLLNLLALALAPVALAFFVIDPLSKKYTNKRHYVLGIIEGFDVMGGYIGAAGAIPLNPAVYALMLAVIFIGGGFDTLISLRNRQYDIRLKLKTFASTRGVPTALRYSTYSHAIASALIVLFALLSGRPIILAGAVLASAVLLAQHVGINPKDDASVFSRVVWYNTSASAILFVSVVIALFA